MYTDAIQIGSLLSHCSDVDEFPVHLNAILSQLTNNKMVFRKTGNVMKAEVSSEFTLHMFLATLMSDPNDRRFFYDFFGLPANSSYFIVEASRHEYRIYKDMPSGSHVPSHEPIDNNTTYEINLFSDMGGYSSLQQYKENFHPLYFTGESYSFFISYQSEVDEEPNVLIFSLHDLATLSSVEELSVFLFNSATTEALVLEYDDETSSLRIINSSQFNIRVHIRDFCNVLGKMLGIPAETFLVQENDVAYAIYNITFVSHSIFQCQQQPKLKFFKANQMVLSNVITAAVERNSNLISVGFNYDFDSEKEGFAGMELSIGFNFSTKINTVYLFKPFHTWRDYARNSFNQKYDEVYNSYENSRFEEKDIQLLGEPYTTSFPFDDFTSSLNIRQAFDDNFELPKLHVINESQITRLCEYENVAYCSIGSVFSSVAIDSVYLNQTLEAHMRTPSSFSNPRQLQETFLDSFNAFHIRKTDAVLTTVRDILDLNYDEILNKFFLKMKPISPDNPLPGDIISHLVLYLPAKLSLLLGFEYKTTTLNLNRTIDAWFRPTELYLEQCTVLSVRDVFGKFFNTLTSRHNIDLLTGVHNMMVHCNFLRNNFVGNDMMNVLDVVPFISNENYYATHEPRNILHKTVKQEELRDIRVEILDSQGNRIRFTAGTSPVHVSLIFKRIK